MNTHGQNPKTVLLPLLSDGGGAYILVDGLATRSPELPFLKIVFNLDSNWSSVGVGFVRQIVGQQAERLGLALDGRGFGCSFCEEFREMFFPAGFALFADANVKRAVLSRLGPAADSQPFVAPTVIRFCAGNKQ